MCCPYRNQSGSPSVSGTAGSNAPEWTERIRCHSRPNQLWHACRSEHCGLRRAIAEAHMSTTTAAEFVPRRRTLPALARAADSCRGCELYRRATQTVFGEGTASARLVLIGEQPGDEEDREGRPFVGPAGRLLDQLLEFAGIDRSDTYVTNAVKHFSWMERGKRRLHKKPTARQIAACRPWWEAELEVIEPQGVICLGATAAQALLGRSFRVTQHRGEIQRDSNAWWIMATWHPSAALRAPDSESRRKLRTELVSDFRRARRALHGFD